jgi:branched-chain amino acid transport system permease protein
MALLYLVGGLLITLLCFIPHFLSSYQKFLLTLALIYGLFAMSYDILLGYTGLVSVCHATQFGIAAYGTIMVMERLYDNLWLASLVGIGLSIIVAWIIGFFSTRARGSGFIIMTIIFALAFYIVTWTWTDFTGGENGIMLSTRSAAVIPGVFSFSFKVGSTSLYYVTLFILTLSFLICRRVMSSPLGMVFQAIKGNEERAKAIGYSVERYKITANIIAGIFASVAGILYMLTNSFVSADIVGVFPSAEVIIWTLLGGPGTLIGPLLAAIFMTYLTEWLKSFTENYLIILGAFFFFAVILFPDGVVGFIKNKFETS